MSRLGKTPIKKPAGVSIKNTDKTIEVQGPKGLLSWPLMEGIVIGEKDEAIHVSLDEKIRIHKRFHGLYRALINNMVLGVSVGFQKVLELVGVGFRAEMQGEKLKLQLGFSNPIMLALPKGIQVQVEKATTIVVQGIDKQQVGQFAAQIRMLRKPEPYKGKGVRYRGERVRRKAGKGAKSK